MNNKCTNCGSENIHRSRKRQNEQSITMMLIRPMRCQDCRARYWVPHIKAYLIAGAASFCGLILAYFIFISILMPDKKIARFEQLDAGKEEVINNAATKLHSDSKSVITPKSTINVALPAETEITAKAKADAQLTELHTDKRHFTVQLFYEKAQNGDTDAQYQLGLLYLEGQSTIQDFEEAAKWFELAAEKNHMQAQYQLGLFYKTGFGVDIDPGKSYMWLNLAAAAGVEKAALARDEIMRSLNPEQLKQAQKSAREWILNLNRENSIEDD